MRKTWEVLLFGLAPAIFVAVVVLLIGIAAKPSKYTATATFEVDWNSMPSVPNDEKAQKVRENWRKSIIGEVIGLPNSEAGISDILDRAGVVTNRALAAASLKKGLRVSLTKQTDDRDLFTVQMRAGDTNAAQLAAGWVLNGTVAKLNSEAQAARGLAGLRSYANVQGVIQTKENLGQELRELQQQRSRVDSPEVRLRINEIEAQLNNAEIDHAEAGLGFLANVGGMLFGDSVKVVDDVHVERRTASYGTGVLLTAFGLGCVAGILGLGIRFVATQLAKPRATAASVPPKLLIPQGEQRPPVVAPPASAKPPILTPPRL